MEDNGDMGDIFRSVIAPMMPLYMTQINGKLETKINKKGLATMMAHPLAKEHLNSVHALMGKNLPEEFADELVYLENSNIQYLVGLDNEEKEHQEGDFTKVEDYVNLWYKYSKKFDAMTGELPYSPMT